MYEVRIVEADPRPGRAGHVVQLRALAVFDAGLASARSFANKIWNASRFLFGKLDDLEQRGISLEDLAAPEIRAKAPYAAGGEVSLVDAWLFSRLAATISLVNEAVQ